MRVWIEDGKHLIVEGEENFNNAGFVDTQRAIPARWVELVPAARIKHLEAELARKDELIREIAATLDDLKSYGFTCDVGPLEHCIQFNAIADKAKEALTK